jgi:hypothetical protein
MFVLPGILFLIALVYVRPQEFVALIEGSPILYVAFLLAVFGLALDFRLGHSRLRAVPQLGWAVAFMIWAMFTLLLHAPDLLISSLRDVLVPLALFALIAHGVQTFRGMSWIGALLVILVVYLGFVGVHLANQDLQCVVYDDASGGDLLGTPDGRSCEMPLDCRDGGEPGAAFLCERAGLFGTLTVAERIRYRGTLGDPNELSLVMSIGMALMFAYVALARRPRPHRWLAAAGLVALVLTCVVLAQSRSGQLVFMTVLGAYFIRRFGWNGLVLGVVVTVALLTLGGLVGSERDDAQASTDERMATLYEGIDMFTTSPFYGVGFSQFTEHHYLTAHNSAVLVAAETGLVGLLLWGMIVYLSFKIPVTILRRYALRPEAKVARTWAMAILATQAGIAIGSMFLSFAYQHIAWIYIGLSGALYSAVKTHDPDFEVHVGPFDVAGVAAGGVLYLAGLFVYLRLVGI